MNNKYQKDLDLALTAARAAGEIARKWQQINFAVDYKEGDLENPVTAADKEIDAFLQQTLTAATPTYGWLSEEIADDLQRLHHELVWIVDPIDGTKSFVRKDGLFSISIALVEEGTPVIGVVYAPMVDEMIYATKGGGVWLNGEKVTKTAPKTELSEATCLISRTEHKDGLWQQFTEDMVLKVEPSIARKLALIGANKADLTISRRPKSEWDAAAGHCICIEAGLMITDYRGFPIQYNRPKTSIAGIFAGPAKLYVDARELMDGIPLDQGR